MILPLLLSVLVVFSSYLLVLSRHSGYLSATLQEVYKEKKQYYLTEGLLYAGIVLYKAQGHKWDFPVTKQINYGGKTGTLEFSKTGSFVALKVTYYRTYLLAESNTALSCIFKIHKNGSITIKSCQKE